MTLSYILLFSVLGGAGSALLASLLFLRRGDFSPTLKNLILSYATGTMLGAALLGMIPRALSLLTARTTLTTVLAGIVAFFMLEKLLIWRHNHEPDCPDQSQAGRLILIGDAVHNAVDGIAIALAFMLDSSLGFATAIAVIVHEIPQEVGDIMILVHSGFSRSRAIFLNTLASLTTVPAALGFYLAGEQLARFTPYALAVSAASFLYIALADLTPDHRKKSRLHDTMGQLAGIGAGIATIVGVQRLFHS